MTDQEIDAMEARRDLDDIIGQRVMRLSPDAPLPHYSTDIGAAWQVLEKLLADDDDIHLVHDQHDWTVGQKYWNGEWDRWADGDTAMLAICRFALKRCKEPLQLRKEA